VVAFDAFHSGDVSLAPGATLVYNSVNTNIGNGYGDHTGFFIAPVAGVYHLSIHCLSPGPEASIDLDLVIDDQVSALTSIIT
jgi:hypothetical protein